MAKARLQFRNIVTEDDAQVNKNLYDRKYVKLCNKAYLTHFNKWDIT